MDGMRLGDFIRLLRLHQWLKNLMLFFPPLLGGVIVQPGIAERAFLPFVAFCCASSGAYIINDLYDLHQDRHHPFKRLRPLPSGRISLHTALGLSAILIVSALGASVSVSWQFVQYVVLYLAVSISYSAYLKNLPVIDIFCIASGFLIRLVAGGDVFDVRVSEWLFLSVFLLALFLSTGKRLGEKTAMGDSADSHRKVLQQYPDGFLEGVLVFSGAAVLVTYAMYVVNRHSPLLLYSIPVCCYGLLHYMLRVKQGKGGDPTDSLLKDPVMLLVGFLWTTFVFLGVYGK
jgi:4-hydroxybenzoate polyprenyltransferase